MRGFFCLAPNRDGLGAVLGGLLTCYFEPLKCEIDLTVLISNFLNDSMAAIDIRRFSKSQRMYLDIFKIHSRIEWFAQ